MQVRRRGHTVLTRKIGSSAIVLMLSGALLGACGVEPATPNVGVTDATVEALIPEATTGTQPAGATTMPTSTANNPAPTVVSRSSGPQGTEVHTINDVPDDPEALVGQTLNVRGQLANMIGSRAFVLRDLPTLGNDQLLIIGANDQVIPSNLQASGAGQAANQNVVVTGTLRLFDRAAIENETGANLQDAQFAAYAGQPVMIANAVDAVSSQLGEQPAAATTIPAATAMPAATAVPTSTTNNQEPTIVSRSSGSQGTEFLTVNDVPDAPEALVGQNLNVRGQLANIIGSRAFVLRDPPALGNDQLLVIAANDQVIPSNEAIFAQGGGSQAAQNQSIVVSGTLRLFNLGAIEDEIGADLQDAQFSQYAGQPVMIARKVEVVSNQLGTNP